MLLLYFSDYVIGCIIGTQLYQLGICTDLLSVFVQHKFMFRLTHLSHCIVEYLLAMSCLKRNVDDTIDYLLV